MRACSNLFIPIKPILVFICPQHFCMYFRCMWNSVISASITKYTLLLAVDNGISWICDRCYFVRSKDALGKGILRSSTSHTFDKFGCEDEDE